MNDATTSATPAAGRTELLPPLRRLFASDDVTIVDWDQQAPSGTTGTGGGAVVRFAGTAVVDGQVHPWALFRKRLVPNQGPLGLATIPVPSPSSVFYWKREFYLYQLSLLDEMLEGFAAPRCLYLEETDGGCTLWLEEIQNETPIWPLEQFGTAAGHLGLFNGLYLAERPVPDYPWLTVNIPRQREPWGRDFFANLDELRQHPIVKRGWPDDVVDGIRRIWQEREQFVQILEQLPRVLQHGDAGRKNLMMRTGKNGTPETVAIDWGWCGVGAVGEEIAPTVISSALWFNGVTPAQLPELEKIVLDGYIGGLRKAGWRGDSQLVQLGYLCNAALRFGPLIAVPEVLSLEWKGEDKAKQAFGWTIEEWSDALVPIRRYVIQCAAKARQLMETFQP